MPSLVRSLALSLALAPSLALAQAYVPSESTEPYAPIAADAGTTIVTDGDDAFQEVTLPFSFRLYGRAYTKTWVSVNGGIAFVGQDAVTQQVYPLPGGNVALPSAARPQAVIAAVWDDWVASALAPGGGSRVAFEVRTLEGGRRVAVFDWQRVQSFATTGPDGAAYSFQLFLYEGTDRYEVRFGGRVGDDPDLLSATSGSENHAGNAGFTHLGCSPACTDADLVDRTGVIISPNLNAELVTIASLDGAAGGGPKALVRVSNNGPTAAEGVRVVLHRSLDAVLDANDPVVLELEPFDLGPRPSEVLLPVTVPLDPGLRGNWRLIAVADPDEQIPELEKSNNVSVTPAFLAGPELTTTMGGPGLGVVGEKVTFAVQLTNSGVQDAVDVRYRIVLSGPLLDAPLEVHRSEPMTLTALRTVELPPLEVQLPDTLYGGTYGVNVEVDPAGTVAENDETNNVGANPLEMLLQGPDVGIVSVAAGASTVAQGRTVPVRVVLENRGGAKATNFTFSVYLSDNDVITLRDRRVFTSQPISLEGRSSRTVLQSATIPADIPIGKWNVGVIVDAEGTVRELDRSNNVRRAEAMLEVVKPAADFAVTSALVEPRGVAGETVRVSALVTNAGAAPVDGIVTVVLSANATPSVHDVRLVDARVALPPGGQQVLTVDAPIPSTLSKGSWTVGVIADPDDAIDEASESNNIAVAPTPLLVEAASFVVTTPWLPDAVAGVPYDVTLATTGGTAPSTWRVVAGALPEGLSLASNGRLSGTPLAVGLHAVTVEATSAGTHAVAAFSLSVRGSAPSLGLVDRRLPPARRGLSYAQSIGAEGGTPPYIFRLEGAAPAGLTLSEAGVVSGFPVESGTFHLNVLVEDATRNVARGLVELGVYAEGAVSLVTTRLREPEAGRAYSMPLVVEGGRPPYTLTVASGALPTGLALESSADGASWSVVGTPSAAGAFAFSLAATDSRGERDAATFVLRVVPRAVRFVTLSLPSAERGERYEAVLETSARPPATFTLAGGELPPGVALSRDGIVSGTVSVDAPQRAWSFAVAVRDATGAEGLAAFAIDVPAPRTTTTSDSSGCSSTGSSSGVLFLSGLLALVLRRRRGVALAAAAVALVAASPAQAYYRVVRSSVPLTPLTGATTLLDTSGSDFAATKVLPVAITFPFSFYGQPQTAAGVSTAGLLTFGSTLLATQTNTKIPTAGAPNAFIAPFWDQLRLSANTPSGASSISYKTEGTAPNRALAIEWKNLQRAVDAETGPGFASYTFQVRLYEGTGEITIHTAVNAVAASRLPTLTGTVGIENLDGTAGIDLSDTLCSPACAAGAMSSNRVVRLVPSADLTVQDLVAPGTLFVGAEATVRTLVRNVGGALAPAAGAKVYLSQDTLLDDSDLLLVESPGVTVEAGLNGGITSRVRVPDEVQPGGWFLLARVAAGAPEVSEDNNESKAVPVVVAPAAPDFQATRLLAPAEAVSGRTFTYTRTVRNGGNAPGVADVLVVLSSNDFVTPADLVLEKLSNVALATGASVDGQHSVDLPATLPPGQYWLGVIVRPADGAAELDSLNNTRALGPIAVRGGALAVGGDALPSVVAGVPFSLQLTATGGVEGYSWSPGRPPPPSGVTLSADGRLHGVLDVVTEETFEVRVASGGAVASRSVTLRSTGRVEPLAIASQRLPVGEVGAVYSGHLKATGGAPPYAWSLVDGATLPEGLALAADGTVEGIPTADGTALLTVRVQDSNGASVEAEVRMPIAGQSRPVFATSSLPRAVAGEAYTARLDAAGGMEPYRFSIVESRRVPNGPGDVGRSLVGALPPGLSLAEDGTLSGTPTETGLFAVSLRVVDARAVDDAGTWLLDIGAAGGLAVRTGALPDATVGAEYAQQLVAEGGTPPLTWEAQLVEGAELPAGIIVTTDGRVVGFPSVAGTAAFLAVVRDASGRVAMRPLAVRVSEAPVASSEDTSGGCSQPGVLGLAALAGLLALRRRRGLLAAAGAAALLSGCVENTANNASKCATACGAPFVCDPADGLCKCGGAGGAICSGSETCDTTSKSCLVATCASGCPAGTACGIDGACHCGGGFGAVCGAGESCEAGACVTQDICAGVVCGAGMACDPSSGGQCRCGPGGPVCAGGERCTDGACAIDLCLGVSCTGGTACDPADGRCRCGGQGGAVCASGEACNAVLAYCERSNRCDGVTCGAGTTCDPADGSCRCGGVGGPRCAADQACDPVSRTCVGGDLCAGATCGSGTSCDPEDGLCKCGGAGGVVCGAGLACISHSGRDACETPCDVFGAACSGGRQCEYDRASGSGFCRAAGTLTAGDECTEVETCGPRLHCDASGDSATCRSYCNADDGCRTGESCRPFRSGNPLGVCVSTR